MPLRLAPFVAAFLVLPAVAAAQMAAGPYVSLGAGVDILQNEVALPDSAGGPAKHSLQFDAGGAGNVAIGYGFGNGLRLEIEGDFAESALKGEKRLNGGPGIASGDEPEYGGFANLAYDFNLGLPVVPYLGVGAGYQAIELHNVDTGPTGSVLFGHGSSTEGAFAFQGMAGVSYPVLAIPGLSLTAEYRLVGVITPPPYLRSVGTPDDNHPGLLTLNNIFNHEALIGLRYSFGTPPPPPPPPPPAASEAPPPAPPTRTYLVFFDWDRADLTDRARQIVAEAATASTRVPTTRIDVNGYTDLSGSAAYNQHLSVRRAESVEAELVRDGVPKTEIVIRGFGETNPLVPTAPGVREPQNRRVEIVLH